MTDEPITILTSEKHFQKLSDFSINQIFVKVPNQDKEIDEERIQYYMDYIVKKYKNVNTRSIISEYSVEIQKQIDL